MPEIKKFRYRVEILLQVTKPEVEHMIKCSESHYDGVCLGASQKGGFLYGWRNQILWAEEKGEDTVEVRANWQIIDTLCKILEVESYRRDLDPKDSLYYPIRNVFIAMGEASERVNNDD
jgi:hypothetical protein